MHPQIALERIHTALVGTAPEQVEYTGKDALIVTFGDQNTENVWKIAAQNCGWDVFSVDGDLLAHEESSKQEITQALALLKKNPLEAFEHDVESGDVSLSFEDGMMLAVYMPDEESAKDHYLTVTMPDGNALSFAPDGELHYDTAGKSRK